ncbi:exported hypothetical protein [Streptomyces misionensis JCM 4497]
MTSRRIRLTGHRTGTRPRARPRASSGAARKSPSHRESSTPTNMTGSAVSMAARQRRAVSTTPVAANSADAAEKKSTGSSCQSGSKRRTRPPAAGPSSGVLPARHSSATASGGSGMPTVPPGLTAMPACGGSPRANSTAGAMVYAMWEPVAWRSCSSELNTGTYAWPSSSRPGRSSEPLPGPPPLGSGTQRKLRPRTSMIRPPAAGMPREADSTSSSSLPGQPPCGWGCACAGKSAGMSAGKSICLPPAGNHCWDHEGYRVAVTRPLPREHDPLYRVRRGPVQQHRGAAARGQLAALHRAEQPGRGAAVAGEGVPGDAAAALAPARAGRLLRHVQQDQVQGAAGAPGRAGEPGAHPGLGAAVVHHHRLPRAQGAVQREVVGGAHQGAVEGVRQAPGQPGGEALAGVLGVDTAAGDRAAHQRGLAAAGQPAENHEVTGAEAEGAGRVVRPVAQVPRPCPVRHARPLSAVPGRLPRPRPVRAPVCFLPAGGKEKVMAPVWRTGARAATGRLRMRALTGTGATCNDVAANCIPAA